MSDYDADLVIWSQRQADLLRRMAAGEGVNAQVDWENIAEEIESLGQRDRRELRNRIRIILTHLIKLAASPATHPQAGWQQTIITQRDEIQALLEDSPSLRRTVPELIGDVLPKARLLAIADLTDHGERPSIDPTRVAFTEDQVLGETLS